MTKETMEMLKLYDGADETGKALILDLLLCYTTCGEPFIKEMETHLENKDKHAMIACINRWKDTLREGATV